MLKKVAFVGAGVGLLLVLLVGTRLPSYASTAFRQVQQSVDDSVSLEFKLEDARNQLQALGPEINQMKYEFARQEMRVQRLATDVETSRSKLDDQLAKIVILKDHLDSGESQFVSNGRSYSVQDVERDLERRWELYKTQKSIVDTKVQVLDAQQAGLDAARQKIAETEAQREALEVEIAQLEARMKLVSVAKTASDLNFDDSRLSRLRESLDDIKSRLEVEEHVVQTTTDGDFNGIPLEDEVDAQDVMLEIENYLGGSSTDVAGTIR